jgi:hypothetical protein
MESGAVIAFYEPDPKIVHTAGAALVKYAYAHSTKLKISAFDNRVFTIRPPPMDRTERYCLSKGSDERLTSYGTFYVVYLGGSEVTKAESIWTLEHHQRIDWFMRDMDPVAGGVATTSQNEGTTTTATVENLYNGMTFTPGGLQPRMELQNLLLEPANVGSGNNVLVTTITEMINNAGVEIPFGTEHLIEGTVHDVCEAIDNFAPQAIGEMAAQAICGGNVLCKIAVRGITSAASAFGAQQVRTYMTSIPAEITSLAHPDLARYHPAALHQMEQRNAARHMARQRELNATKSAASCLLYHPLPVTEVLNTLLTFNTSEVITDFMLNGEMANTGFKLDAVRAVKKKNAANTYTYLNQIQFFLRGAAIGDTLFMSLRAMQASTSTGGPPAPVLTTGLSSLSEHAQNSSTSGLMWLVAGKVTSNHSGISIEFLFSEEQSQVIESNAGWLEIELYYATQYGTLFDNLYRKYPLYADPISKSLVVDKWAIGATLTQFNTLSGLTRDDYLQLPLTINAVSDSENSGLLLDVATGANGPTISLRNFPPDVEGWVHCHYFVQTYNAVGDNIIPLIRIGDRYTDVSTSRTVVNGDSAIVFFKARILAQPGTTGIKWTYSLDNPQPTGFLIGHFVLAVVDSEDEVNECHAQFRKKMKLLHAVGGFEKI